MTTPAPYPADTKPKGWRFELDHERIRQSDTWVLAKPEQRPWLLMLWMVAWEQTPCGSLPADDELIAARIGMSLPEFNANKRILLRGWTQADDGRLYHPVLTERVLEMIHARDRDRNRKANYRNGAKGEKSTDVQPVSHGTDDGQTEESTRRDGTRTSTSNSSSSLRSEEPRGDATAPPPELATKKARKPVSDATPQKPDDVDEQTWTDWLRLRRAKKAPVTETVLKEATKQADLANLPLGRFLAIWCNRGTQGLEASWLKPQERGPAQAQPPAGGRYAAGAAAIFEKAAHV